MPSFEQIFDRWLASLTFEERSFFFPYSLRSIQSLRQVRIDWGFLSACSRYWDPVCHVFRLGETELCPLAEELGAILGYPEDSLPTIPVLSGSFTRDFQDLLGLTRDQVKSFSVEGEVDLRFFILLFFPYSNSTPGVLDMRYRKRAFLFCLLDRFLFVGVRRDRGYPFFVRLVEQIIDDYLPAVMVLGETLMALDRVHVNPHEAYSGSPLLLQIWLQEHLACIQCHEDIYY